MSQFERSKNSKKRRKKRILHIKLHTCIFTLHPSHRNLKSKNKSTLNMYITLNIYLTGCTHGTIQLHANLSIEGVHFVEILNFYAPQFTASLDAITLIGNCLSSSQNPRAQIKCKFTFASNALALFTERNHSPGESVCTNCFVCKCVAWNRAFGLN